MLALFLRAAWSSRARLAELHRGEWNHDRDDFRDGARLAARDRDRERFRDHEQHSDAQSLHRAERHAIDRDAQRAASQAMEHRAASQVTQNAAAQALRH